MMRPALLLLALLNGAAAITYIDPAVNDNAPAYTAFCHRMTTVFGVKVCIDSGAFNGDKREYIVNSLAQVLDNDEDGAADDERVVRQMRQDNTVIHIKDGDCYGKGESPADAPSGRWWCIKAADAHPNTCDRPDKRGAAREDRSSWEDKRDTSKLAANTCDASEDKTYDVIFLAVLHAAAHIYPHKWALTWESDLGKEIRRVNADCGFGYTNNYHDPSNRIGNVANHDHCSGYYSVQDAECKLCNGCVVYTGALYATRAYLGALYTKQRHEAVRAQWTLTTPDTGMATADVDGRSEQFQKHAVRLYDMFSMLSSRRPVSGHGWVPYRLPNGNYNAFPVTNAFPVVVTIDKFTAPPSLVNLDNKCTTMAPPVSDDDMTNWAITGIVVAIIVVAAIGLGCAACCGVFDKKGSSSDSEPTA